MVPKVPPPQLREGAVAAKALAVGHLVPVDVQGPATGGVCCVRAIGAADRAASVNGQLHIQSLTWIFPQTLGSKLLELHDQNYSCCHTCWVVLRLLKEGAVINDLGEGPGCGTGRAVSDLCGVEVESLSVGQRVGSIDWGLCQLDIDLSAPRSLQVQPAALA